MRTIRRINDKVLLHPVMAFIVLTAFIMVLSGILDLFDASVTYSKINSKTGGFESTLVTVESLLSLSGIKYIFSNTALNFVSFAPLTTLLIVLLGVGVMEKSGFLDTVFFVITNNIPKSIVTYVISLICIVSSLTGDLGFVVFIPIVALLFKYAKRNPMVGIILSFVSISLGYGANLILNSVESTLATSTELAAHTIISNYVIGDAPFIYIMIAATLIGAGIITYITEKIIVLKLGKYVTEEEIIDRDKLTKKEKRGLIFALVGAGLYLIVFIYNIIPKIPFGGNFLDYSQVRYIDKLFGNEAFFNSGFVFIITMLFIILGLLYGLGAKTLKNHRDVCDALGYSLDGIGKVILSVFCASLFISLLKYSNIGMLITASLSRFISDTNFTGIPLILLIFFISLLTTFVAPSLSARWSILSCSVVPKMMTAGFAPEFSQLIFTAGSSVVYGLTPVLSYFVIYIAFMEKYDSEGAGLIKGIRYIIPYAFVIMIMWLLLIISWYLIGLPLGINSAIIL